jgi:hypothetical protein
MRQSGWFRVDGAIPRCLSDQEPGVAYRGRLLIQSNACGQMSAEVLSVGIGKMLTELVGCSVSFLVCFPPTLRLEEAFVNAV